MTRIWSALALLGLLAACEPLDPMRRRQQKVLPYQPSPLYADGISMRPPPEGTVPVEAVLDRQVATGESRGKPLSRSPLPVTPEVLETGRKRFEIICATCHGLVADGQSMVTRNLSLRQPPSLITEPYLSRSDGYFFQVITKGFGLMPSYAAQLPDDERWAVVSYLRALQLSQHQRIERLPPEIRARLQEAP
jgi:mono/diheme cytochrome c family protein